MAEAKKSDVNKIDQMTKEERLALLTEKAEELSHKEADSLVIDFDRAYDEWENQSKPLQVKFQGKTYEISRHMPMTFTLFYTRHCLVKKQVKDPKTGETRTVVVFEIPDPMIEEYLTLALGREFVEDLSLSQADLGFVMQRIMPMVHQAWNIHVQPSGDTGTEEAKNAKTPGS